MSGGEDTDGDDGCATHDDFAPVRGMVDQAMAEIGELDLDRVQDDALATLRGRPNGENMALVGIMLGLLVASAEKVGRLEGVACLGTVLRISEVVRAAPKEGGGGMVQ